MSPTHSSARPLLPRSAVPIAGLAYSHLYQPTPLAVGQRALPCPASSVLSSTMHLDATILALKSLVVRHDTRLRPQRHLTAAPPVDILRLNVT